MIACCPVRFAPFKLLRNPDRGWCGNARMQFERYNIHINNHIDTIRRSSVLCTRLDGSGVPNRLPHIWTWRSRSSCDQVVDVPVVERSFKIWRKMHAGYKASSETKLSKTKANNNRAAIIKIKHQETRTLTLLLDSYLRLINFILISSNLTWKEYIHIDIIHFRQICSHQLLTTTQITRLRCSMRIYSLRLYNIRTICHWGITRITSATRPSFVIHRENARHVSRKSHRWQMIIYKWEGIKLQICTNK